MEVDEGGGGYGFARRDNPARKKVGRRVAVHSTAPVAPAGYAPSSQKPFWVWLLIGFLLGTGGTLLMASFWLPQSGNRHIATVGTDDSPSERNEGVAAATVPELSPPEEAPSEPRSEAASVAALGIESVAATPRIDEASPPPDDVNEDLPDPIQETEGPAEAPANETLLPAAAPDNDDDIGRRSPIDVDRSTASSGPEQALSALVSEAGTAPTETPEPASLPGERSDRSGLDRPGQGEGALPPPEDPAFAEKPADPPVTAELPDELVQGASSQSSTAENTPTDDDARSELPPRIRQALRAAEAQSAAGTVARSSRLYRVQLAAVDNEAAARVFWREVNERLPGVFADVEPIFNQRLVEERLFLRIWVGAFENRLDADGYCGWLKLKGQDCFVTRVDNL